MTEDRIQVSVKLLCSAHREAKNRWVTTCPSLRIASQGKTLEAAKKSLREAIQLWFESCLERDTLDEAMRELGFQHASPEEVAAAGEGVTIVQSTVTPESSDSFHVDITIPAYQAAALLSSGGGIEAS